MNDYYIKLGIGKDKVSKHLPEVKKKISTWSAEEREAAIVSLEEDICDGESYNMIFPTLSFVLNILVTIFLKIFYDNASAIYIGAISILGVAGIVLWWACCKERVYKHQGLLCLLKAFEPTKQLYGEME